MIRAPKGHIFLAFDYAQIEARVIAMGSRDKTLCNDFIQSKDIHGEWRDNLLYLYPEYVDLVMHKLRLPDSTDEKTLMAAMRDRVKNEWVFASLYGSSVSSCIEAMGIPLDVGEQLGIQFWEKYAGVKKYLKSLRASYQETGTMSTLTGRLRYQMLFKFNEPVNNPSQGTAADIVSEAMNEMTALSRQLHDPYLHPRMQVHDDLMFILPDNNDLLDYVDTIGKVLTKVRFPWQCVPLGVEGKVGESWGNLEKACDIFGGYNP